MTRVKIIGQFARVVGYYRSVDAWNEGKKQEWKDRVLSEFR
jgi:anaerobic ribonucleoside-triphosphate reductase